jgi:hypothetical protein
MEVRSRKPNQFGIAGAIIAPAIVLLTACVHSGAGASPGEHFDLFFTILVWIPLAFVLGGLVGYGIGKALSTPSFSKFSRGVAAMLLLACFALPVATGYVDSTPPSDAFLTTQFNRNLAEFAKAGDIASVHGSTFEQGILGPPEGAAPEIDELSETVHAKMTYPEDGCVLVMWRWGKRSKGYAFLISPPTSCVSSLEHGLAAANKADDERWYLPLSEYWYLYIE